VDDTICTTITVCVPAVADFMLNNQIFGAVDFMNMSSATTTWAWDFGDSSPIDNTQNPSHTYAASGTYNVCLIASSGCSADTICQTVTICLPAAAAFTSSSVFGAASFTDGSAEATTWAWDFGDSSPVDNTQNPTHTYATGGNYTVCLIVTNGCSADTFCTSVAICLPVTATYTTVVNGDTASFTDGSMEATTWAWDFGDSSPVDNSQNPVHVYAIGGTYNVCLVASNSCSADTICTSVTACVPATAGFTSSANGGMVQFTDTSTEGTSWLWDFGDTNTSTQASPTHSYAATGTYNVCLIVSNACSADTICTSVTVCVGEPIAAFTSSSVNLVATFTNNSTGAVGYMWDFGDSQTSTSGSPVHTYGTTGMYFVCLTAWNECGDTASICDSVFIDVNSVNDPFTVTNVSLYPNPFSQQATLEVESAANTGAFIFGIYDTRGALVSEQQGVFGQRMTIDGSQLAPGLYFYKVSQENSVLKTGKLVISK
jgi:PKD repeat protein